MDSKKRLAKDYLKEPYTRVIVPDEDGAYVAEILEFEGCFADGSTPAEALRNLDKVATMWIAARLDADQFIPEPQGNLEMSGRFALRMPQSLHQKAAIFAEREGVSLNTFIVNALAGSVGIMDFIDRYAKPRMDQFVLNQLNVIVQIRGTYETVGDVSPLPVKTAMTLSR